VRAAVRWLLLAFAVVIFVDMLVGDQGLMAMFETERQRDQLTADIARKRAENAGLAEHVRRLNEDPSIIEELARELGLIKPGEKVFILKDLPSTAR
jgi:cell division protein FtsB